VGIFDFKRPTDEPEDYFLAINKLRELVGDLTEVFSGLKQEVSELKRMIRRESIIAEATRELGDLKEQEVKKNTDMLLDIYDALTAPEDGLSEPRTVTESKPPAQSGRKRRVSRLDKIPLDPDEKRPLITIYDVAERIGVHVSRVYDAIYKDRFPSPYKKPGYRQSFYVEEEIKDWISDFQAGFSSKPKPSRAVCENEGCKNPVALKEKMNGRPIYRKVCDRCHRDRDIDETAKVTAPTDKEASTKTPENKQTLALENYRTAMSLNYSDLETGLFRIIARSWIDSKNNQSKFRSETYRLLSSQALDLFRDGKTLGQIKMMQPRSGVSGGPNYLSVEGVMSRVVKAIFKLGTPAEISMLKGEST
jgi:predicted DNA-binding transcriptional regulator AlpA